MKNRSSGILIASISIVILAFLGIAAYYYLPANLDKNTGSDTNSNTNDTDNVSDSDKIDTSPYLIYAETISETNNASRSWPTINIYRTNDGKDKELLATVGKVNEYPIGFTLSPDKSYLLINLESKIQKLDLKSKKLTDLIIAQYQLSEPVFSPDKNEIFAWDKKYASNNDQFAVHRYNLATNEDSIIKSGTMPDKPNYLTPFSWRDDNKIAMYEPLGESVAYWYYDLSKNEYYQSGLENNSMLFGSAGNLGKRMTLEKSYISDICNDFSGQTANSISIIDNINGEEVNTISSGNTFIHPITFSPQDDQILYYTTAPLTSDTNCDKTQVKTYYVADISTGVSTPVNNPEVTLKKWGVNNIGAEHSHDYETKTDIITFNSQTAITSDKYLQIIAQYWK